jgi:hypothetical protein
VLSCFSSVVLSCLSSILLSCSFSFFHFFSVLLLVHMLSCFSFICSPDSARFRFVRLRSRRGREKQQLSAVALLSCRCCRKLLFLVNLRCE